MDRRLFVKQSAAGLVVAGCGSSMDVSSREVVMPNIKTQPLTFPFATEDPFLFCAYHDDRYPAGDANMGPPVSALAGRNLGMDFSQRDGWSMYHGQTAPGFPRHPHRGFETITVARRGLVDHSDSFGATARYGHGDVQWMTAGRGIEHAEMFPLLEQEQGNHLDLFQVWLNLPASAKMTEPHFTMFWSETIPKHRFEDAQGKVTTVTTIAGALEGQAVPAPPPASWASRPDAHVAVWTIDLEPGATWTLPAADPSVKRNLYFYWGETLDVAGQTVPVGRQISVQPDVPCPLVAGARPVELLLLEGRPIGEPVAHRGPFVMNTQEELIQAVRDYQRGGFGRWPWAGADPVHPRGQGRFALHMDGRRDEPGLG